MSLKGSFRVSLNDSNNTWQTILNNDDNNNDNNYRVDAFAKNYYDNNEDNGNNNEIPLPTFPCIVPRCNHRYHNKQDLLNHLNCPSSHPTTSILANQKLCNKHNIFQCCHGICPSSPTRFFNSKSALTEHLSIHHKPSTSYPTTTTYNHRQSTRVIHLTTSSSNYLHKDLSTIGPRSRVPNSTSNSKSHWSSFSRSNYYSHRYCHGDRTKTLSYIRSIISSLRHLFQPQQSLSLFARI